MPKRRDTALTHLCERIGYAFKDRSLLELALTHASARIKAEKDNERLEFLGDRVLGLAIADLLNTALPDASVGELNRRFAYLVRWDTCANVASDWQLLDVVRLEGGKVGSGASRILGDACEAVLGAIFVDGGFEPARGVVQRFWEPYLQASDADGSSAKSSLQEWAQGRGLPLPRYVEIAREGPDHAPRFTTEVVIDGIEPERGQGANKQASEQAAALAMLRREGVWQAPEDE